MCMGCGGNKESKLFYVSDRQLALQRKAEELVGEANVEDEAVLKNQINCAVECANTFYKLQLIKISEEFSSLRDTIGTLYDLHSDLELKKSIEMPVKHHVAHSDVCCDDCHPTRSEKARGKVLGREGVLKGVLEIDCLRSFSLLNAIAIKKVLERHCTQNINDICCNLNDCQIIEMKGLSDVICPDVPAVCDSDC
ncbi:hypothetical protein GUITHDRAFT_115447 [Guillardia theta CCMP2712]|uniref:Uncharacterized protein n=1 Tax=Guillardia theta (strain CCMP2712) TaxID=905079 RepID=L1IQF5_GUITC|nr:hypothetical protein GUITHDRAFT_115447 [Guillardia theta CCMP2712]EKX38483.1 hypothetical protein GUITHDRAFT_115447 [Guillardia theta CCMP2712]|eukprot:XP_005825463.1 hypothetical protein GUITHDRAFT_115447 [Guillardia theta CCMP2712]